MFISIYKYMFSSDNICIYIYLPVYVYIDDIYIYICLST